MAFFTVILWAEAQAQTPEETSNEMTGSSTAEAEKPGPLPIFVAEIPAGYRDWKLISVAREEGKLDDIRAVLGNNTALKAYRDGQLPFPDGAIIARLAWSYLPSEENNKAFGHPQSFVAGTPKNGLQFMVKDSKKYAATGGWGFAQFDNGKPAGEAVMKNCFSCQNPSKAAISSSRNTRLKAQDSIPEQRPLSSLR